MRYILYFTITCFIFFKAYTQNPFKHPVEAVETRYANQQPVVNYTLEVDTAKQLIKVEMRLENISHKFQVAMFAHPEYDDRYWRFIKDIHVQNGTAAREDSALWEINIAGNETTISYTIHLPPSTGQRAAWRPFLSSTGGLIGGPQCYMYMVGAELAPCHVQLRIPQGWQTATGLEHTFDPTIFFAPTVSVLLDDPILIGNYKKRMFTVAGVPHTIAFWEAPGATKFNDEVFSESIHKIVEQAKNLFGRLPYREYYFLLQDDSYGSLEHANSVTLGIPTKELETNAEDYLEEIAHEYFHSWNLVRIHPAVYDGSVSYKKPPLSKELWWSEGLTMYYADVLLRRGDMRVPTRINHLKDLLTRYYDESGNYKISPETISLAAYGPPGMLGNYEGSTHLQGELIGMLLDIFIRNKTNNRHSIDDVMRKMNERFSAEKGFIGKDVEQAISDVCGCSVHSFFENYIHGSKALPFNEYLALIGLRSSVSWKEGTDEKGKPYIDLRVYAWEDQVTHKIRIGVVAPDGVWAKAGLNTGDNIISVNGHPVKTTADFYSQIRNARLGDNISIEVKRNSKLLKSMVKMASYQRPVIAIDEVKNITPQQKQLQEIWKSAR